VAAVVSLRLSTPKSIRRAGGSRRRQESRLRERYGRIRWTIGLVTVACAVCAVALAFVARVGPSPDRPTLFAEAAAIVGEDGARVTRGRVSGMSYAPPPAGASSLPTLVDLDREIEALRAYANRTPDDATAWSDLSAALVQLGSRGNDVRPFLRAFAAGERALRLDPAHAAASFNRAVALESAGLRTHAITAWKDFLLLGEGGGWSVEARRRLQQLDSRPEWSSDEEALRRAALRGDAAEVERLVRLHPMRARRFAETPYLARWGAAVLAGNTASAAGELRIVRAIADALRSTTGESMLFDGVASIDRAGSNEAPLVSLAHAHVAWDRGRQQGETAVARELLEEAARRFEAAGSPFAFAARHYAANIRYSAGDPSGAEAELRQLLDEMPPGCRALRAQTWWMLGTIAGSRRELHAGVRAYLRASESFEALGEREDAATTAMSAARILLLLGRGAESWPLRGRALRVIGASDDPWSLQTTLAALGVDALREREPDLARAVLTLALAVDSGNHTRHVELLRHRARAAHEDGDSAAAENDLARARVAVSSIDDAALAATLTHANSVAEARIAQASAPHRAIRLFDDAIAFATARGRRVELDALHLDRARAWRAAGDSARAIDDLRVAIELLESGRDDAEAVSAYSVPDLTAYHELADLLQRDGNSVAAFEAADRGRVWRFMARDASNDRLSVPRLQQALPAGAALLHYTVLEDSTLVFAVTSARLTAHRIDAGREELRELTAQFSDRPSQSAAAARSLGARLLLPLANELRGAAQLVIVPDATLAGVPFGALVDPTTNRHALEDRRVTVAPSAAFLAERPASRSGTAASALVVADPAFDSDEFPELPRLRAAAEEASTMGAMYPRATLLVGEDATKRAVLDSARTADLIHVAAHMERNDDLLSSAIILASDGSGSSLLTSRDVLEARPLNARLVVLAGCGTADVRGGGGIGGLATAFLGAGAGQAVGTLWDVEDEVAREFSTRFHRLVRDGLAPAEALRRVQREFLASDDERLSGISAWGAFQLYGSIAR
jgi:CHAT domain-containing protein